jgi:hypothetical protein
MRTINLLPKEDELDKRLDELEFDALDFAHKFRVVRLLRVFAKDKGVNIDDPIIANSEKSDKEDAGKSLLFALQGTMDEVIESIMAILADSDIKIPEGLEHEIWNPRFIAMRGRPEFRQIIKPPKETKKPKAAMKKSGSGS